MPSKRHSSTLLRPIDAPAPDLSLTVVAPSKCGAETHAKWMRLLKTHQCTIDGLFTLDPAPVALLKEKLAQVEALVSAIGAFYGQTALRAWNRKIATWWTRLATAPLVYSRLQTGANSASTVSWPSKYEIITQLKRDLGQLQPLTDTAESLSTLQTILGRARTATYRFWSDGDLAETLFGLLFIKLPPPAQRAYISAHEGDTPSHARVEAKNLRVLQRFLDGLIAAKRAETEGEEQEKTDAGEEARLENEDATSQASELSSEEIIRQIEDEFSRLDAVKSRRDIESLRALMLTLSSVIHRNYSDRFKLIVFMFALRKLPHAMQARFQELIESSAELPNKKALLHLRQFLGDTIVEFFISNSSLNGKGNGAGVATLEMDSYTKGRIESVIARELAAIGTIAGEDDIERIRSVLEVLARARLLLRPYTRRDDVLARTLEGRLMEAFFDALGPSLQTIHREATSGLSYSSKSLSPLNRTLVLAIRAYFERQRVAPEQESGRLLGQAYQQYIVHRRNRTNSNESWASETSFPPSMVFCGYCKAVGQHSTADCPLPKRLQCYRCFQIGHKAKGCPLYSRNAAGELVELGAIQLGATNSNSSGGRSSPGTGEEPESELKRLEVESETLRDPPPFGPRNGNYTLCLECVTFGHRAGSCPTAVCFNCRLSGHMSSHCRANT